jgi:hypothetical protein
MEEDILNYDNRDKFFHFLIEDFNFVKLEEKYYPETFGDFYIVLSGREFLLRYSKSKSFLSIEIASYLNPSKWTDLTFVKNFIYNPSCVNPDEQSISTNERIEGLNNFLRNDFNLITDLFSRKKYKNTQEKIDKLLQQLFEQRFPQSTKNT